jgi:hypothetical protein
MMESEAIPSNQADRDGHLQATFAEDEAIDITVSREIAGDSNEVAGTAEQARTNGTVRTLDGEIAGDEFASDAINYQILLGKIDALLDRLKLDA